MELNAEQVKTKLEQLASETCMTGVTIKGHSVVHLLRDTLALITSQEQKIKELTEENKNLEQAYECADSARRELSSECDRLTEENERLRAENEIKSQKRANIFEIVNAFERGRTDGVRKMQERLKQQIFSDATPHDMELLHLFIDGVANEMLKQGGDRK